MKFSLCCLLKDPASHQKLKSMTWKRFQELGEERGLEELGKRWLHNFRATHSIIRYCANRGWNYRFSSSIMPLANHPDFPAWINITNWAEIWTEIQSIERTIKKTGIGICTHPSQFCVLASENEKAVENTIRDLNWHGWIMDQFGLKQNHSSPIFLHLNCSKGDLREIKKRLIDNLSELDIGVQSRISFEGEDRGCWNVQNLVDHFYQGLGIPICWDSLHVQCNPSPALGRKEEYELAKLTWNQTPWFHWSGSDKRDRSHGEFPKSAPFEDDVIFDVEFKQKDLAIERLECLTREGEIARFKS